MNNKTYAISGAGTSVRAVADLFVSAIHGSRNTYLSALAKLENKRFVGKISTAELGEACISLSYEKYYYRIHSYLLVVVILHEIGGECCAKIIVGGAGAGVFNIGLGAVGAEIKWLSNILESACRESDWELKEK
jgi:hypothetical protein